MCNEASNYIAFNHYPAGTSIFEVHTKKFIIIRQTEDLELSPLNLI